MSILIKSIIMIICGMMCIGFAMFYAHCISVIHYIEQIGEKRNKR